MSSIPIHIKIQDEEYKKYRAKKVFDAIQKVSSYPLNFKRKYRTCVKMKNICQYIRKNTGYTVKRNK